MYEFLLPDLGEGVVEAEIIEWLVKVGQEVTEDDPLCEVDTDKAAMEIPSPVDGTVASIHAEAGEMAKVGSLLISFATADDAAAAPAAAEPEPAKAAAAPAASTEAPATSTAPKGKVAASPIARRVAADLGVDLTTISGTGPRGSIVEDDVRAAAESGGQPAADGAAKPASEEGVSKREPLQGVRRHIAENLTRSHQEIPKVTVVEECDLTALAETRGDHSYVTFTLLATLAGLKDFPEFNARLEGDELVYLDRYDIGVAAQGPKGLMVPVVRGVDKLSVSEIDAEVIRLATETRSGKLKREDMVDATFTVTNAGKLGGYFATPLINPPEVAILGVHRAQPRPVVRNGEIVIRTMALVSCSFDHRVTDGGRATSLLLRVIEELERGAPDA